MRSSMVLFIGLILCGGGAALLWSWTEPISLSVPPVVLLFWFLLCVASEFFWLPSIGGGGMVSMSLAANLALLFALPAPWAVSIASVSVLLSDQIFHKRDPVRALFNAGQTAISMGAALLAMGMLGAGAVPEGTRTILLHPLASLAALPVFFVFNTGLVSAVIALASREGLFGTWRRNYGNVCQITSSVALFFVAIGVIAGMETIGYVAGLASLIILLVVRDAYRAVSRRTRLSTEG